MRDLSVDCQSLALAEVHAPLHEQAGIPIDHRLVQDSDSRTARSAAWKPICEWVLSQNGLVFDAPQRQSATGRASSGGSNTLPSPSISRIGPGTLSGPSSR